MTLNKNIFRLIGYLSFAVFCLGVPWFLFCIFIQNFSFEVLNTEIKYIENIGYLGSFVGGTLGALLTAGSLIFLAKTLDFERKKSDQENFNNRFFLMLERLESIKDKIDEDIKNKILNEIDNVIEFSVEKTLEESKKIIHKYNSEVGHYYRMLYQIVKMVDQNKDKIANFENISITYYTNMLRSTLDFKMTQILAVNTYCSKTFDSEYQDYAKYVRKYNFFEHMPFRINSSKSISESLLAVYVNCDEGFGNSSFIMRMNKYMHNRLKDSKKENFRYDLKELFIEQIVGNWKNVSDNLDDFSLEISKSSFKFKSPNGSVDGSIISFDYSYDEEVKYRICDGLGCDISSYLDEELNLIVTSDEYVNEEAEGNYVELKLILKDEDSLNLEYINTRYHGGSPNILKSEIEMKKIN